MINLSENLNLLYPNEKMIDDIKKNIECINNYPENKNLEVNKLIANQLGVINTEILITNGSLEAIDHFFRTQEYKTVGIVQPTFWGYENCAVRNRCKVVPMKMKNPFKYTLEEIENLIEKVDLLVLCNPNNPSLAKIDKGEIEHLLRTYPQKKILIDETVLTFDKNFNTTSVKTLVSQYSNLYVCFSYSKIFGIPGLRLGALISNEININKIKKITIPYSLGTIQQNFLVRNYDMFPIKENVAEEIQNNFDYLVSKLPKHIISRVISKGYGFILIQFNNNIMLEDLHEYLIKNNINVRNITEAYREMGENWIRISSGSIDNYNTLINTVNNYMEK